MREGDDRMSSEGERERVSSECSTSKASGWETEARDLGGEDAEGSGVDKCIVSTLPHVA